MVDSDLVLKKLAFIETCVRELRTMARPELLEVDLREERFVVHTLQLAAQAAIDAASHIASSERLGEPETNRQLFELLRRDGWISEGMRDAMQDMAGFRNVVVHGYEKVDLGIVRDILEHHLDDLTGFATTVRQRLLGG